MTSLFFIFKLHPGWVSFCRNVRSIAVLLLKRYLTGEVGQYTPKYALCSLTTNNYGNNQRNFRLNPCSAGLCSLTNE